jgi:hypothetical protein
MEWLNIIFTKKDKINLSFSDSNNSFISILTQNNSLFQLLSTLIFTAIAFNWLHS